MKLKYKICIEQSNGDSVIMNEYDNPESAYHMFSWYEHHKQFFNGDILCKVYSLKDSKDCIFQNWLHTYYTSEFLKKALRLFESEE